MRVRVALYVVFVNPPRWQQRPRIHFGYGAIPRVVGNLRKLATPGPTNSRCRPDKKRYGNVFANIPVELLDGAVFIRIFWCTSFHIEWFFKILDLPWDNRKIWCSFKSIYLRRIKLNIMFSKTILYTLYLRHKKLIYYQKITHPAFK